MTMADILGAASNATQLIVVVGTAFAALRQLRHLAAKNDVDALLAIKDDFAKPEMRAALTYVQNELATKLGDPVYRAELARAGFVDPEAHPEMTVLNWFGDIGTLVKHRAVGEDLFLDLYGRLTLYYWDLLQPTVALLRRKRGQSQYESFEYLMLRARRWYHRTGGAHTGPVRGRVPLPDPYLAVDEAQAAPAGAPPSGIAIAAD